MAEQKLLLGNVRGPQGPAGPNEVSASTTTSGFENGHVLYNDNGKVGGKKLSAEDVGAQPAMSSKSIKATGVDGTTLNSTTTLVQYGDLLIANFSFVVPSGKSGWFTFAQTDLAGGTRMYAKASSVSSNAPIVDFSFDGHTAQVYTGSNMAEKVYSAFVVVPLK